MNILDFLWSAFLVFAFVAYLMILFSIIADLFRDRALGGFYKSLWIIFLIVVPYITAFVYLIARGRGMAVRQYEAASRQHEEAGAYIREMAQSGPAHEIAQAKSLLESQAITADEFDRLKEKALA
ncbi:hypothetical protein [Marisediminicola senii]|uniref:hypothetical protein n=1 Tax=Marisediminicola senii TaxID=2711233 RepID=UPI0013EC8F50|nr:hypothetical protein [Marisediminicola senii]